MKFFLKIILVLVSLLCLEVNSSAQKSKFKKDAEVVPFEGTKWSADLGLGIPLTFLNYKSDLNGLLNSGIRYSFNKSFSAGLRFGAKTFSGTTNNPLGTLSPNGVFLKDVVFFKTAFYDFSAIVQYNLTSLLGIEKPNTVIMPFVTAGLGVHLWKQRTRLIDGKNYVNGEGFFDNAPMTSAMIGLGFRYFLNPSIDLVFTSEYNYINSNKIDGASSEGKNGAFLNNMLGLSFKLKSNANKNIEDWKFKNRDVTLIPKKDFTHWSVDLNAGMPFLFTPFSYSPTGMGGVGVRYSFSPFFSVQGAFHYGFFGGENTIDTTKPQSSPFDLNTYKEFSTSYQQFSVRGLFNLRKVNDIPKYLNSWNYYAVVGGSYTFYSYENTKSDNEKFTFTYNKGTQNIVVGLQARRRLNSSFDFLTGVDFNINQTKWLDGIPEKDYLNHHLYINAGISYKFGVKIKNRELIDWTYKDYKKPKKRKNYTAVKIPKTDSVNASGFVPKIALDSAKVDTTKAIAKAPKAKTTADTSASNGANKKPVDNNKIAAKPETTLPKAKAPVTGLIATIPDAAIANEVNKKPAKPAIVPQQIAPATKEKTVSKPKRATAEITPARRRPKKPDYRNEYSEEELELSKRNGGSRMTNSDIIGTFNSKYNVVVGCYALSKLDFAIKYRNFVRSKGINANIYKNENSRYYKILTYSTNSRKEAILELKRARKMIDAEAWMQLIK